MLRTVHLHGRLGERFGKTHELDVESPAEAVRALMFQHEGFEAYLQHRNYCVTAGRSPEFLECPALTEEQLAIRLGKSRDIHIVPAPLVAGIETIIIVGLSVVVAAVAVAAIFMMRTPKPEDREEATKRSSYAFDGAENSIEQGHAVPLVYGEVWAGSVVASAGITTSDFAADPNNPPGGKSGFLDGVFEDEDEGSGAGGGLVGVTPTVERVTEPPGYYGRWNEDINLVGGGGKGGGGGDGMQEAPNSLQSNATARILEVISEGEIVGLVNGLKSVYLDGTPLQNSDGSYNFQGATVTQRVGLPTQDYIPGFTQAENTINVDTEVSVLLGPVVRTINNVDVTIARVTIRVPALYEQDTEDGDIGPTSVKVQIAVQADGGGYVIVHTMEISGKTNQPYDRSVDVHLPAGTVRQVKVTRLTPDSTVSSLVNDTRWQMLSEVVEAKLSYPDSAMIGMMVDARQFGTNIPTRAYHVKGLIVEVPSNYNPVTRVYTGVWNGTFKRAYTNNPAWCLRDLIVNRRYGLGARIPVESVDKWALYSIAQYCDQLVPNGFGGQEPRYTLNTQIKNKLDAYQLIAAMASNFRGWVYWGSGTIVTVMDRPEDPTVLVTRANTVDGAISYGRITPHERRRSAAVVYWNDPADGYRLTPEIVEDAALIRRFGRRTGEDVTAFGVTRKGHAHRLARFMLEDESPGSNVSADYEVGEDHSFVAPGRIAMIADPMFTQHRRGGRLKAATANGVTLDQPMTLVAGQTYSLRTILPDGTVSLRAITNAAGTHTVLTLGGVAWVSLPNPGAVWTIESNAVANRQFRVRAIETDRPPYRVKAVAHDPTKYARVELDRDIETPDFSDIPTGPLGSPTQIGVFEYLATEGTASIPCALFSWTPPPDARVLFFQAQAKPPGGGDWFTLGDSLEPSRTVRNIAPGLWQFRVRSVGSDGRVTIWEAGEATMDGQTDALPEVIAPGITVDSYLLAATLIWDRPVDTRPLRYEVLYSAGGGIETAVSLGLTDKLSYPITLQGNYWVRTWFLGFTSPAPTMVNASALIFTASLVPHLTKETVALPANNDGSVISYSTANGTFKVYSGSTDISSNFTLSTPAGGDPQALTESYTGMDYAVTAGFDAGEETAQLRIRATGSGDYAGVVLDKDFTLTKAKTGGQGNYIDTKFKRSLSQPATPTGASPAGWSDGVPPGTETVWQSNATKTAGGTLIGVWSTPQAITALVHRGAYSSTDFYYLNNTVTFNGGTYIAVQDNFTNQPPSGTGQSTAYWDVIAAPGSPGEPGTPPSAFSATINLTSGANVNLRTVANAAGYTGSSNATITFKVPNGVVIRGAGSSGRGIDTGTWPTSSYTIALTIIVESGGIVDGGGGKGGDGGQSPGGAGGAAIYLQTPISGGITINSGGTVRGGGGGGGGGANREYNIAPGEPATNGGGGGGGGFPNGGGGAGGWGDMDQGSPGSPGTTSGGGAGGAGSGSGPNAGFPGGNGGGAATAGTTVSGAAGGAAGKAVAKNGHAATVTNNGTMTGAAS